MYEKEKGITLIALIITIIVMLILVGVTVNVAINGGLFSTAKKATAEMQFEADKESLVSAVIGALNNNAEVDFGKLDSNLPDGFTGTDGTYTSKSRNTFYVGSNGNITDKKKTEGEASKGNWKLSVDGTVTSGDVTLKIGDYVNYTPSSETKTYSQKKLGEEYTGSASNTSDLQTDTDLKWRVLGVDANGCLTLISDKTTSNWVYLKGAKGYNNEVYILNDICEKLYSNKELGITARSLNIEDVEEGFNETGIAEREKCTVNGIKYGDTKTYTDEEKLNYPVLYAEENGSGIGITEEDAENGIKKDGIGESDPFYKTDEELTRLEGIESKKAGDNDGEGKALTCTQTYYYFINTPEDYCKNEKFYEMVFNTSTEYWLASRCVRCDSGDAIFALHYVYHALLGGSSLFTSDGGTYRYDGHFLRPVVSLGSNITIETVDNNSGENPHKIPELE